MTRKRFEVLLGSGNYFRWECNLRMTLERNGLLLHVQVTKKEKEMTDAWLSNDAKALGIIAQGIKFQHQTKIRWATTDMHAWDILRDFYNRITLHNRVEMTRRLHEFKMKNASTMSKHLDDFDELGVGPQTLVEPVDDSRQLVVLLSILPMDYELISSIVANSKYIKETMEKTFSVSSNGRRFKGGQGNGRKGDNLRKINAGIKGKYFKCGQVGHYKRDCLTRSNGEEEGAVFAAGLDGRRIMMVEVMHIPGLDKRLLSVGKLAGRGMRFKFQSSSCVIWSAKRAIASDKKISKARFLNCEQEEGRLMEYAGAEIEWELWHARLENPERSGVTRHSALRVVCRR
uniref:CCHC-type domain-containing protein n=1 Tax=Peronospora matthiolae TaxID=2874970 RepID=A0AAV1TM32_9STRA